MTVHKYFVRCEDRPVRCAIRQNLLRRSVLTKLRIFAFLSMVIEPSHAIATPCDPTIAAFLKNARRAGDALVILTLPDLGPLQSPDVAVGGHGRKISLLLKRRGYLNTTLAALNQKRDRSKPLTRSNGLTSFDESEPYIFLRHDIFFSFEGEVVTDILWCNPPGSVPSPGCDHWIDYGAFQVRANYGRDWLPKWHDIRIAVTTALDRCDVP